MIMQVRCCKSAVFESKYNYLSPKFGDVPECLYLRTALRFTRANIYTFCMAKRGAFPPYIQRGIMVLVVVLMGVSVGRLLIRVHQQEEHIEQLEEGLAALNSRVDRQADAIVHRTDGRDERDFQSNYRTPHNASGNRHSDSHRAAGSEHRQTEVRRGEVGHAPATDSLHADTASHRPTALPIDISDQHRSTKYSEPRRFNLNHIDSATLVRIPGIAARTASTILRYRSQYGGFYDPWQLQEFLTWEAAQAHMQEWCTQWFTADVSDVRHIRINQATVAELRSHPYITFDQAVEIVRYRTRHKRIEKLSELDNFPTFTPDELKRLSFYLSFE